MLTEFLQNFRNNLFQPLLLFFYAGFLIPIFKVKLEFPKAVYQALTIYLLLAIGWEGGEKLAALNITDLRQAVGFMIIGIVTNTCIGVLAYFVLRSLTKLRNIDAATVAGYYGSDSAGTFVTARGILDLAKIPFAAYMPVMLAVMEIPGCLVALYIVSRLRHKGMDPLGNMPGEPGYNPHAKRIISEHDSHDGHGGHHHAARKQEPAHHGQPGEMSETQLALEGENSVSTAEITMASQSGGGFLNKETLHEVFMNPGIFLLFAGILIGFIGRLQGEQITAKDDPLFHTLFHGMLCIFLLEMGLTACSKLRDLHAAGWQFVLFAVLMPNVFATTGMFIAHGYSTALGQPFDLGTYVLFAVLCGASSYIAVPAVQRMAIPEASPTLPLAASLGCTFSYNVTIGIPVYMLIAKTIIATWPVVATVTGG